MRGRGLCAFRRRRRGGGLRARHRASDQSTLSTGGARAGGSGPPPRPATHQLQRTDRADLVAELDEPVLGRLAPRASARSDQGGEGELEPHAWCRTTRTHRSGAGLSYSSAAGCAPKMAGSGRGALHSDSTASAVAASSESSLRGPSSFFRRGIARRWSRNEPHARRSGRLVGPALRQQSRRSSAFWEPRRIRSRWRFRPPVEANRRERCGAEQTPSGGVARQPRRPRAEG